MPGIDESAVLIDLANYRAKSEFFSKTFLWESVSKITPTAWWKGFCSSTELCKLASRFLELPATSAACERSFSTYGGVHTKKRNRLTNERAAKIVYISHNLKLQKQDVSVVAREVRPTPSTSFSEGARPQAQPNTSTCSDLSAENIEEDESDISISDYSVLIDSDTQDESEEMDI